MGNAGALADAILELARVAFSLITRLEELFKGADRGAGYIVAAQPVSRDG